jgi:hypothetical protein
MKKERSWTEDQLREAVASSTTFKDVLRKLGLRPGSIRYLREAINDLNLDISRYKTSVPKELCSDERLRALVSESSSCSEILHKLGSDLRTNDFYRLRYKMR